MKVATIVGARPQFIKSFPVSEALDAAHDECLIHTGQHYDDEMSDVFFRELPISEPDINLGVGSKPHAKQTAAMLDGLYDVVADYDPDILLLYGDTNSTLAGALVGAKRDVDVAHVEAGLRSHNRQMPEEINRILADHCSDILFAPSERATEALAAEGITRNVVNSGDVMYDSLLTVRDRAIAQSTVLERLGYDDEEYVLATIHRAGNTERQDRLEAIISGLGEAPLPVVFPAHPRTVQTLEQLGWKESLPENIDLIEPVGYLDFVRLLVGAERVATDSGGIQKEAFYLDTPCVTLRDETEWVETVESGWNVLAGAERSAIKRNLCRTFDLAKKPEPYGDGNAANRIVTGLSELVDRSSSREEVVP